LSEIHSDFGWLTFIATPLYFALRFVHAHIAGNWGWTIILVTAVFNLLLLWPRLMMVRSSLKMMRMQPSIDALKKRYGDLKINDPKRTEMNTEMMALYKAEGANMYGGCLPMLLQMPLLFGYMRVLNNAVELHHAGWFWLTDLAMPDPLHILPLLIIGAMFVTQWITPMPGMDPLQKRIMAVIMPLVMGFSLWRYAAGLGLYWATGNLISLGFQILINRSRMGAEMRDLAVKRRRTLR
jgi:YidC/Oxa1 family membrane protein insertase